MARTQIYAAELRGNTA